VVETAIVYVRVFPFFFGLLNFDSSRREDREKRGYEVCVWVGLFLGVSAELFKDYVERH